MDQYTLNTYKYFELLQQGELIEGYWVVIVEQKVLIQCQERQEALHKMVLHEVENCYFSRVGYEDDAHTIRRI